MTNRCKIGIWGQYGDGGKIADGQAVRTTIITNELITRYGEENISVVNTNRWEKHPISFAIQTIRLFLKSEKIIVLPADNGFRVIVVLYDLLLRFKKRELYDVVIGGYLPNFLVKNPKYVKMLSKYNGLFVQTEHIKKDMEQFGLKNVYILSNPKRLNTRKASDISINTNKHVSVCVFSRISEDKGIEDAISAVKILNDKLGGQFISLDIYGMILPVYKERFLEVLEENKTFVKYRGIADYNKTVETLSLYFALLFPTFFHGEGFPGSIVDSFNTGLPIIASDWLYNKDVITHEVNGLLVPARNPSALSLALERLYNDRELAYKIAKNNLEEAEKYKPDLVLKEFYTFMD